MGELINEKTALLLFVNESINAERYRDNYVRNLDMSFDLNFSDGFVFIDENALPHRAGIVTDELRN